MNINERVERIDRRQEDLIAVVVDLTAAVEANQGILAEIAEWLQKPASSELHDLLRSLVLAVNDLSDQVDTTIKTVVSLGNRITDIPNQVVKVMKDGEA